MKFQAALSTLLRSGISFALLHLIFLFLIYLVIQYNDSLMLLELEERCSSILCKEIE